MPKATLIFRDRVDYPDGGYAVLRAWSVPHPVAPSEHGYKYSVVYIVRGKRVIGYDNERGKGDHRHLRTIEMPYQFVSLRKLLDDFRNDVKQERGE
ncbi:MAG TPA: DUF6516 family protein [Acetobacteraceae bacterium]